MDCQRRKVCISYVLWSFLTTVICGQNVLKCASTDVLANPCLIPTNQGTIDLTTVDAKPGPKFNDVESETGYEVSYNPCTPFTEDSCINVAVCQFGYSDFGVHSTATCGEDDSKGIHIQYTSQDGNSKSLLYLKCDETVEHPMFVNNGSNPMTYAQEMILTCTEACLKGGGGGGLSTGSILYITLFVFVVVYFTSGMLYMRYARGSRGVELIPNLEAWKEFPGLVKDGGVFVIRKVGKRSSNYDKI